MTIKTKKIDKKHKNSKKKINKKPSKIQKKVTKKEMKNWNWRKESQKSYNMKYIATQRRKKGRKRKVDRLNRLKFLLFLTGFLTDNYLEVDSHETFVWKVEHIEEYSRPGIEASQGLYKGTRCLGQEGAWMDYRTPDSRDVTLAHMDKVKWRHDASCTDSRDVTLVRRDEEAINQWNAAIWLENEKWGTSGKYRNKMKKITNGNGGSNYLKKIHWNIGARQWHRKIEEIEALISEKDPDFLFVSEANIMEETSTEECAINGYVMVLPNTMNLRGYARIALLVKENIEFEVLNQFMPEECAAIWISVGRRGRKPLRIGGFYREHTLLRQGANPNLSNDLQLQIARWDQYLACWKAAAANEANCILVGDLNLDYLEWGQPNSRHLRMVEKTKLEVETTGFTQLVRGMTSRPRHYAPTSLSDNAYGVIA